MTRRTLAAILSADVVGYSRLMEEDEAATYAALRAALDRAAGIVAARDGVIASTAGDAFVAWFPSVRAALEAALELQREAPGPNGDRAASALLFRIGIDLGDVIEDGGDVYGGGVNIAARVQALAEPGGVMVTAAVREQLRSRLPVAFEDQGARRLKNIATPVRIFAVRRGSRTRVALPASRRGIVVAGLSVAALAAAGLLLPALLRDPAGEPGPLPAAGSGRPVVAVTPFEDRSVAPVGDYFADGVTEDVIAQLGRFPELVVLSWNAVATYGDAPLQRVARDLGARYVVDGAIARSGKRMRVTVQLSDARRGALLWSERYDERLSDIFALQDRISRSVAGQLATRLTRLEQDRAREAPAERIGAYELVLRGRARLRTTTRAANLEARELFQRATTVDPEYAAAYVGLGWTHSADVLWGWSHDPPATLRNAERAARRAIALESESAPAHALMANILRFTGRLEEARREIERALVLNPNDPTAHAIHGTVLLYSGESTAAIPALETARRLDPLLPVWTSTNLAQAYYFERRYEDARALLEDVDLDLGEDVAPHAILAAVLARMGRPDAARREVETVRRLYPFFDARSFAESVSGEAEAAFLLEGLELAGF